LLICMIVSERDCALETIPAQQNVLLTYSLLQS
jgi:hypothetical protein